MTEKEPGSGESSPEIGEKVNRLIGEKSPYLLQHARNPVDWYPWGDEAFEKARTEDKPVFLSIGYSTCHWCHVMAHESFEDEDVARLMNDAFVSIKVDREERPDIDQVYMTACQMMTGRGGWPLSIIMTPDKRPFFAATYIPKEGRMGMMGMRDLIPEIKRLWRDERGRVLESAGKISQNMTIGQSWMPGVGLDASALQKAYLGLSSIFDPENGGFGGAPKFPTPHNLMFLLRQWKRTGDPSALDMVETTLQAMRMGGIYDHLGFGFHRYSTDASWTVPHFEKMLYDQALLAITYAEAYQATHKDEYARTLVEILAYIDREMKSPEGGFYSAEDADSEGVEGKFYVWKAEELRSLLDRDEYALFSKVFEVDEGNFEGKIVLAMRSSIEDVSEVLGIDPDGLIRRLDEIRKKLFAAREVRVHPGKDDKILVDWNGLAIAAFARAASVLGDEGYAGSARRAADFLLQKMRSPEGRLLHRYRGEAGIQASADDYAFLIWGLLEIYEAVFDPGYIRAAIALQDEMFAHFWDEDRGGFYFTPDYGEKLPVRQREIYDGAIPSANSVSVQNLLRLSGMTGREEYAKRADEVIKAFSGMVDRMPAGYSMLMTALHYAVGQSYEVAIVEGPGSSDLLKALRSRFVPNKAVILIGEGIGDGMRDIADFTKEMRTIGGRAAAYVCRGHACELPTTEPSEMMKLLGEAP